MSGEQASRLHLAQAGPHLLDQRDVDGGALGDGRRLEAAVARLVETLGQLQRDAAVGRVGEHQLDLLEQMEKRAERHHGRPVRA